MPSRRSTPNGTTRTDLVGSALPITVGNVVLTVSTGRSGRAWSSVSGS